MVCFWSTPKFSKQHIWGFWNFGGRMLLTFGGRWKIGIFYVSRDERWCLIGYNLLMLLCVVLGMLFGLSNYFILWH